MQTLDNRFMELKYFGSYFDKSVIRNLESITLDDVDSKFPKNKHCIQVLLLCIDCSL